MKPIFKEERDFFKKHTGLDLPESCWRDGSKIYLDPYCSKPLITFKAENGKITITKNNSELFNDYAPPVWKKLSQEKKKESTVYLKKRLLGRKSSLVEKKIKTYPLLSHILREKIQMCLNV